MGVSDRKLKVPSAKPKTPEDFNKVAEKTVNIENIKGRVKELTAALKPLTKAKVSNQFNKGSIKRISTKKEPTGDTTTITYLLGNTSVEIPAQQKARDVFIPETFLPVVEITFDQDANPVGEPQFFWRYQQQTYGESPKFFGNIPAPELSPQNTAKIDLTGLANRFGIVSR